MDLTKFILPYPYEAFDHYNRKTNKSFEDYKEKSTSGYPTILIKENM